MIVSNDLFLSNVLITNFDDIINTKNQNQSNS